MHKSIEELKRQLQNEIKAICLEKGFNIGSEVYFNKNKSIISVITNLGFDGEVVCAEVDGEFVVNLSDLELVNDK